MLRFKPTKVFKYCFFFILLIYFIFKNFIDSSPIFNGELGLIEIFQIILLLSSLVLIIKNKSIFYKEYNKLVINFKIAIFAFLTYEEISFITAGKLKILNRFNFQSELKLHNLNLWYTSLIKFPLIGKVGAFPLIVIFFLFLIGILSYSRMPKYLFAFSLEKVYFPYSFIYLLNLSCSKFLSIFSNFHGYILMPELVEFLLYFIFYFNILSKLEKIRLNMT